MEEAKNTSEAPRQSAVSPLNAFFDTLTERTAKALVVAAGWLEKQAKVVRDLADRLEKRDEPGQPAT